MTWQQHNNQSVKARAIEQWFAVIIANEDDRLVNGA